MKMNKVHAGRSWKRRLIALLGAVGLLAAGLFSGVGTASGAPSSVQPTDPSAPTTGTLTIHKINGAETGDVNNGTELSNIGGEPLDDVTFSVKRVTATSADNTTHPSLSFDLTQAAGWKNMADVDITTKVSEIVAGTGYSFDSAISQITANGGVAKFENLPLGLYLVQETDSGPHSIVTKSAPFLVTIPLNLADTSGATTEQWLYDVHTYPKNNLVPSPEKSVSDPDANLGGTLTWTLKQGIPLLNQNDSLSLVRITDTLDAKLAYDAGSATVSVEGLSLSSPGDYSLVEPSDSNGNTLTVTFTEDGLTQLRNAAGKDIVVTFTTTVKEEGKIDNSVITNVNGYEFESAAQTTEWGKLVINKVDGATQAALNGAEFDIFNDVDGAKGDTALSHGAVADGKLEFGPLWIGNNGSPTSRDYWIVETHAPDGYVLDTTARKVTISAGSDGSYVIQTTVSNYPPIIPGLPLTGSSGTVIIVSVGVAMLLLAAGLIAVRRSKMSRKRK
jgi:fimbrial isopeptide formation D2 family protein/LPXTG-motif cell wall-anchored protein